MKQSKIKGYVFLKSRRAPVMQVDKLQEKFQAQVLMKGRDP